MVDKAVQVSGRMVEDQRTEAVSEELSEVLIPKFELKKRSRSFCFATKPIEVQRRTARSNSVV